MPEEIIVQNEEEPSYLNASIDALLAAYLKVLQKVREERPGEGEHVLIARDDVSLRGQIRTIIARLTIKSSVCFEELLSLAPSRTEIAVTFWRCWSCCTRGRFELNRTALLEKYTLLEKKRQYRDDTRATDWED